ncbi:hypothetical protein CHARACLAT_028397 [Characodon lateralis]|uniref:Uncharacterized protein n=1 Tax=Characodon lateralis TaxID=208331 RepID=A0ABU7CW12_9TELE|nr:hypothetical protein [Characodon lateralis]
MNQEPHLSDLAGWQLPGFLAPRQAYKNLVHPPPFSTAPTSVFLDPLIILAHSLVSPLSSLWRITPLTNWFPGSCFPVQVTSLLIKHITVNLCLLSCFSACGSDP